MNPKVLLLAGAFALVPTLAWADYCRDCNTGNDHSAYKHALHHKHAQTHDHVQKKQKKRHRPRGVTMARVVNVEPVYRYYTQTVEKTSCLKREVPGSTHSSWTPTVLGAVIGGAVGHRVGDSHGDANAAAIAGGILGAAIGRDVALHNQEGRSLSVRGPCRSVEREQYHREPVEYVVTYRYNDRIYRTHMDRHPGEWVELDVKVKPV